MPVISTNQHGVGAAPGWNFTATQQIVLILSGIVVDSDTGNGVSSNFHTSTLNNRGIIFSEDAYGVNFGSSADWSIIHNFVDGIIVSDFGVSISGDSITI